jgi:outer membrane protein, heavy metal efflux system
VSHITGRLPNSRVVFSLLACSLWLAAVPAKAQNLAAVSTSTVASTATTGSPPSLQQALEAAWALDANAKLTAAKQAEVAAKQKAASGWFAGAPSVSLAHRTDRLNKNAGLRELEAEVDVPIWNRNTRAATQSQIEAEDQTLTPNAQLAKLKLAGNLRGLMADHAVAQLEHDLASRKVLESEQLAGDIERRLRAGDVARLDALQVQANTVQAKGQAAQALALKQRLLAQWTAATGLAQIAPLPTASPDLLSSTNAAIPQQHPALLAARAQLALAQAKLRLSETDTRDPMELALGITRERSAFGAAAESNLRVALRIPLSNNNRNMPRITAARTEVAQAQAELDVTERQLLLDISTAIAAVQTSQALYKTMQERAQIAAQSQSLITRAYSLGERDLQARLRADSERYEADLAAMRALAEQSRASAQLQQALGLLP